MPNPYLNQCNVDGVTYDAHDYRIDQAIEDDTKTGKALMKDDETDEFYWGEGGGGASPNFVGTHAEWNALTQEEKNKYIWDEDHMVTVNFTDDAEPQPLMASEVGFDNTISGLSATNVQTALDSIYVPMSASREIWVDPVQPHVHGLFESHTGQTMYVSVAMNDVNLTSTNAWVDCGPVDIPEGYRVPLRVGMLCLNWTDHTTIMVVISSYNDPTHPPHHVLVDGYQMGTTGLKAIRGTLIVPIEKI